MSEKGEEYTKLRQLKTDRDTSIRNVDLSKNVATKS